MLLALAGKKVGFIGAGTMATAMIQGLLRAGVAQENLCASDPFPDARDRVKQMGVSVFDSNSEVAKSSDVIVLAVKPNVVSDVLTPLSIGSEKLVVSIAAGVTIETIEKSCLDARVVRTMPNVACLVGEAAVGASRGALATDGDMDISMALFSGVCVEVAEKDLDAVTAVSGSGPAYVFVFVEALADAGVRAGLTRQVALRLAIQTVKGASTMLGDTGTHPAVLKDQVCSPGGTTIAAIEALETNGFRSATMSAVAAANKRSKELR